MTKLIALAVTCLATAALADDAAKPAAPDAADAKPAAGAPVARKPKSAMAMSATDLKWHEVPESHGVQMAPISGNAMKGAYKSMAKFPADSHHPLHSHSNDLTTVVVSGTFLYGADDASAKEYGPGSYVQIPGGKQHVSGCKAGAECTLFQMGAGKFDMTPAGGADAKK